VLSREQAPAKDPVPIFTLFCNRNSSQPADRLFACRAKCTFETVERQDDQQGSPAAEPDDNEWTKWTDQRGTEPSYFFTSNNSRHLVLHKGIKLAAIRVLIQVVWTAHETWFVTWLFGEADIFSEVINIDRGIYLHIQYINK
jgi:hypothetical protein